MVKDCNGNPISIGSKVRVLRVDSRVLDSLPRKERIDVQSMVGEVLEVFEIRGSLVRVEKSWNRGRGKTEYHMLSLAGEDVEIA